MTDMQSWQGQSGTASHDRCDPVYTECWQPTESHFVRFLKAGLIDFRRGFELFKKPFQFFRENLDSKLTGHDFDFILCNGVLHHTANPYKAFCSIVPYLKKNGYILIGLYNKIGRTRTNFRRYIYKIFGEKITMYLDPILRKIDKNSKDKIEAYSLA